MRSFYTTALILGLAAPGLGQTDESSRTQSHLASLDSIMGEIVALLSTVLLFDFGTGLPLIVAVLLFGGIFYSFYFGWFSIRAFRHAIDVVRGIYDDPNVPGEISHFKALHVIIETKVVILLQYKQSIKLLLMFVKCWIFFFGIVSVSAK